MSIKPIDSQVILHSTPDAAKIQSSQVNKDENGLIQASQNMQKKIEQDNEQVKKTENTYKVNKADNKHKEKEKEESEEKEKKKKQNNQSGSVIDVRV